MASLIDDTGSQASGCCSLKPILVWYIVKRKCEGLHVEPWTKCMNILPHRLELKKTNRLFWFFRWSEIKQTAFFFQIHFLQTFFFAWKEWSSWNISFIWGELLLFFPSLGRLKEMHSEQLQEKECLGLKHLARERWFQQLARLKTGLDQHVCAWFIGGVFFWRKKTVRNMSRDRKWGWKLYWY